MVKLGTRCINVNLPNALRHTYLPEMRDGVGQRSLSSNVKPLLIANSGRNVTGINVPIPVVFVTGSQLDSVFVIGQHVFEPVQGDVFSQSGSPEQLFITVATWQLLFGYPLEFSKDLTLGQFGFQIGSYLILWHS